MIYSTISLAHDALMNKFNMTQMQLRAARAKLEEATELDKEYLKDSFGDPIRKVEYDNFKKKLINLHRIEKELSIKSQILSNAIGDFNEHNW